MTPLKNAPQGSSAWHAARAQHFCASEASAAMGASKYTTRDALIHQKATGVTEDVTPAKQRLFDAGHEAEALARPIAERIAGVEFSPIVGTQEIDGMKLLASFDGIDLMDEVIWENKLLNASLIQQVKAGELDQHYWAQLEHQLLVSGAERALFTTSDGTDEGTHHLWYESVPERRLQLIGAWKQFAVDLAAYVAPEAAPQKVVAEAVTALPTVFAQVTGSIALKDNLPEYEVALRDFIDHRLITKPESDQDFANLDLQIKALKGAEAALDASEEQALSQAEMLSAFKRQKDMLHKLTRDTRLAAEKLLAAEKERIKLEQVQRGQKEFAAHIASLNTRLGKPYMPQVSADFAGAIKGKRTVDSLRDAVNTELARAKIAANEIADRIQVNLTTLRELASAHAFLFADTPSIVLKAADDLTTLVKARITEHDAKVAAQQEAERARIRAEEEAKAQRAVREAEDQRERERQEEQRQQILQKEREEQAAIAAAAASQELAAPVAQDLSTLAREKTQEAVAGIDAAQAISTAQRAASAAPAVDVDSATLLIGAINAQLGYIVNAAFLAELGFHPARIDGARRFYRDSDLPLIGHAIAQHTLRVTQLQTA